MRSGATADGAMLRSATNVPSPDTAIRSPDEMGEGDGESDDEGKDEDGEDGEEKRRARVRAEMEAYRFWLSTTRRPGP